MQVREERTGWRDEGISRRHRQWGFHAPALDIDFLLVEYDMGRAMALVEYKHECAARVCQSHPSIRALTDLADRSGLPAFVVRYADDHSWYYPIALNDPARHFLPKSRKMSERDWVGLLYAVRGRKLPPGFGEVC